MNKQNYYNTPSDEYQWAEKSSSRQTWENKHSPFAPKLWSKSEIKYFKDILAASYNCNSADIVHKFARIDNDMDDDRHHCVLLKYILKFVSNGEYKEREIYNIKILVPDEILQRTSTQSATIVEVAAQKK